MGTPALVQPSDAQTALDEESRALAPSVGLKEIAGWGNVGLSAREHFGTDLEQLSQQVVLSRGMGRSYGDSSLPPSGQDVLNTCMADRILAFDRETGRFRAEAGLTLHEINRLFLRQKYFVPVTPGTQFVTLGGMVAADVHGKGHHRAGCFGSNHVTALKVRVPDGRVLECTPDTHAELFWATIGGMGLTGHILEVEFVLKKIPSPWIWSRSERIANIDDFQNKLKEASDEWPYCVGWIDCLSRGKRMGRGILDMGRWAEPSEAGDTLPPVKRRLSVPFTFPSWVLNPLTVRAFNTVYYWSKPRVHEGKTHPESFFYPLDAILHWNPDLWAPRLHPVPVRFAQLGGPQLRPSVLGPSHPQGRRVVSLRDQGLRRAGSRHAVVSDAGYIYRPRHRHPRRYAAIGR